MKIINKVLKKCRIRNSAKEISDRYYNRFVKYSFNSNRCIDEKQYEAVITRWYHTIEKGLAYVNYRAGFGKNNVDALLESMENYVAAGYDKNAFFFQAALSTLEEYIKKNEQYGIENQELKNTVERLGNSADHDGGGGLLLFHH